LIIKTLTNAGNPGSIARYSVWPRHATACIIGMLRVIELRKHTKTQLDESYDVREFHSTVITSGSMPLNVIENIINQYIVDKLQ